MNSLLINKIMLQLNIYGIILIAYNFKRLHKIDTSVTKYSHITVFLS